MPKFKIPVQLRKAPLSGSIEKRHGTIKNELNAQTVIQKPTNSTNKDNPCPKVLNIVKEPASIEDTIEVLEEESWLLNEGDIIETVEEISQVPVQSTNEISKSPGQRWCPCSPRLCDSTVIDKPLLPLQ